MPILQARISERVTTENNYPGSAFNERTGKRFIWQSRGYITFEVENPEDLNAVREALARRLETLIAEEAQPYTEVMRLEYHALTIGDNSDHIHISLTRANPKWAWNPQQEKQAA